MTQAPADDALPLAGIRVLDVSTFIAAPAAAVVMADYGADVIKVEQPGEGDPNRRAVNFAAYPKSEVDYPWQMDSRNKRSIAIDLKQDAGRAVFSRLVESADVMITNFPIPVRERNRIRYEDVAGLNPRLVYASLTGYGETGDERDAPGFDSTAYFARSGFLDVLRFEGQPPHFSLPASGDRATAMALLSAVMIALFQREKTGRGMEVGTSLLANGLWSNGVHAQAALVGAFLPTRPPRDRPRSPLGNSYCTRDGRWFQIALAVEEGAWPALCRAVDRPELEHDPRFARTLIRRENSAALTAIFDSVFVTQDLSFWRERLAAQRVTFGIISRLEDLKDDAQARAAGAVVPTENEAMPLTIAAPIRLGDVRPRAARPAPRLGEQTDEILVEVGYDADAIAALRLADVVA